jgi:hypothetical protein
MKMDAIVKMISDKVRPDIFLNGIDGDLRLM